MEENKKTNYEPARQVLIATDGSKAAENAADFGIEIAGLSRAKVYAVYVIDVTSFDSILMDEPMIKEMSERFEKIGLEATSYVEQSAKAAGLEAESILLKGNPAKKILDFAEERKVDMIVIGSIGKSRVERLTLGSVSEKVVRHAKIPVLVVREIYNFTRFFSHSQKDTKIPAAPMLEKEQ
jgi:nucleotide-binding universal stress UspA family protein